MSTFKITIPFTPRAKASVRRAGTNVFYNPSCKGMKKTREYVLQQASIPFLLKGPLLVIVHYRIPAPLGTVQRKRDPQHNKPHNKRPDGDNLEKFLNDSLNGVVWTDDSQIAWLVRSKSLTKAKEGETILFVRELGDNIPDYCLILSEIQQHIRLPDDHR